MSKALIIIGFILLSCVGHANLSYEACDCTNENFTERITSTFIANANDYWDRKGCQPKVCEAEQTQGSLNTISCQALNLYGEDKAVPDACFLASMRSNAFPESQSGRYRVCGDQNSKGDRTLYQKSPYPAVCDGKKKKLYVRRPCISKDYVKVTSSAFHEVNSCLGLNPARMFTLFNHESRFLINNVSPRGALCYGQLTAGTVENINNLNNLNYGYYKKQAIKLSEDDVDQLRFDRLEKQCPELMTNFSKLKTERGTKDFPYISGMESKCDIVENPYTCFMYSALNHKKNLLYAQTVFKRHSVMVTTNKVPPYIFGNKKVHDEFLKRHPQGGDTKHSELKYKQMPVFKNFEEVSEMAALWSYNGGQAVAKVLLPSFLTVLQQRLDNSKEKELRSQWLKNGGLSTEFFEREFGKFIKEKYRWPSTGGRKDEVSDFVPKIMKDAMSLTSQVGKENIHQCVGADTFLGRSIDAK